ncbi:MAG: rod shape-determining protein MreD [Planctomycetota bacterium]|jgi:rod shape-determining protein MreD
MRWLRFALLILIVMVLQASLLSPLKIKPDLLLILLVFFAIYLNPYDAIITSFTIGFAADVIGFSMGPMMLSFGLLGSLLAQLQQALSLRKMPFQAAAIFVVGIVTGILAHFFGFLKGRNAAYEIISALVVTSICSAVIGPFLFLPSAWWMRIKTHRYRR